MEKINKKPKYDLTGKTFGNLKVIKMEYSSHLKNNYWQAICKCNICSNESYKAKPCDLKNGSKRVEDCGCGRYKTRTRGKDSTNFTGIEEMSGSYFSNCKKRAEEKGFLFDLDIKYLWEKYLFQDKKCALSGVPIIFSFRNKMSKQRDGSASLDRIDSNKGYTKDNIQWVHKTVNLMKNILTVDEFLSWCKIISDKNIDNNLKTHIL